MKKELLLHFLTTLVLLAIVFLLKFLNLNSLEANLSYWPLFVGGFIGMLLPDVDHVIYIYYLRPYEVTSQRVMYQAQKGNLKSSWDILSSTREERVNLILHTILFQVVFVILSFLVVTSSVSLLGLGLVLAFLLHLLVDQILDLNQNGNIQNWFKNIPIILDKLETNIYLIANAIIILVFGILL